VEDSVQGQLLPFYRRWRSLSRARNGGFWAAHLAEYQIDYWNPRGKRSRILTGTRDWFPGWPDFFEPVVTVWLPTPNLIAVHQDPAGLLWTVSRIADAHWKPLKKLTRRQLVEERSSVLPPWPPTYDPYVDTIIEVIDPETGRLLASRRFDIDLRNQAPADILYSRRVDENGESYIDVWRPVLRRGRR
jgi:hypothetical protein